VLILQRNLKKVIDVSTLDQLQRDIVETLVRLEMHFSPTYFDISMHLLVHLVDQIRALHPMYLHQMFPFERLMKVFRRYIRNRFRPEGGMVEGWSTEEAIELCKYYLDINRVRVLESRHEKKLGGKGTIGEKSITVDDLVSFRQAQYVVLQQTEDVMPYIDEHRQSLQTLYPSRSRLGLIKNIRRNLSANYDAA
jgi:hypothetical protein